MQDAVESEQGRVKPCLACEELFDFDLSYCPNCGSLAMALDGSDVPHDPHAPGAQGTFDAAVVVATAALAALSVLVLLVTMLSL
jgi:hypothetical protein